MKIGNTQILSKNIQTGTNIINFTDTQLDAIYKLYNNNNSLTVTFILMTGKYTNSKTCTITLKRQSENNKKQCKQRMETRKDMDKYK